MVIHNDKNGRGKMGLVLFSIVFILVGLFVMWKAIFGTKKEVKEFSSGIPADFSDFFLMIIYKLFPPRTCCKTHNGCIKARKKSTRLGNHIQ
jgi:hypothetical protein